MPSSRELGDRLGTIRDEATNATSARSISDDLANGAIAPSSFAGHGSAVPLLNVVKASANAGAPLAMLTDSAANTTTRDAPPRDIDVDAAAHGVQLCDGVDDATRILVLVDADEGVHLALDDDAAFDALPHPFAPKAISHAAHEALAAHGVTPGSTTFDAAEAVARAHPLLRPRVF